MLHSDQAVAILLADITGSTPLFEKIGDAAAALHVSACIDELQSIITRKGGCYIASRGDDVLCTFSDPSLAIVAAREMLLRQLSGGLAIHAGLHFGPVVQGSGNILGDAVNLTARLASLARPGEVLLSQRLVDQVSGPLTAGLRLLDGLSLKGKSLEVDVFSLLSGDVAAHTEMPFGYRSKRAGPDDRQNLSDVAVILRFDGGSRSCNDRTSLWIGRSADCDIVFNRAWISRQHALIKVGRGKVQLEDRSSGGTYVSMGSGQEVFLRRETVLLTGSGVISPAMQATDAEAVVIRYEIVQHP